ncbi:MAG: homoserine dehydrogenase [Spirochaetes bacterium]|nr:homoserine dehydrogenase [Spirochaetota bacterium]
MPSKINIGLVGLGTVGSGVARLLEQNGAVIARRTGVEARLKTVCDLAVDSLKERTPGVAYTKNWKEVTGDPEIDVVVELIGGIEPAKSIILAALAAGKHVVTANKKLLAEQGREIFEASEKSGRQVGFEASVGGGIPCIVSLRKGLAGNRVQSISGILNGTTNFILTKMEEGGLSFKAALAEAQRLGFAEADPTFDVGGFDAAHKISIVSMLAYNRRIDYGKISIEGITRISDLDILFAREMGYVIKLLGISKLVGDEVDIRVHPAMIHHTHPLAGVRNEFNAIMFVGDMTGPVTLTGKGAGSLPTASAVVGDVVQIASGDSPGPVIAAGEDARYLPPGKRLSRYYMRIRTKDQPGILARISGTLGQHGISLSSVIQKEVDTEYVPLLFMTHMATEEGMLKAVKEIDAFDFVDGPVTLIRVEDPEKTGGQNA